jgi:hypothetical protein
LIFALVYEIIAALKAVMEKSRSSACFTGNPGRSENRKTEMIENHSVAAI